MEIIQVHERPILFSGEMVKAILDGRKSQTRRVLKPEPFLGELADEQTGKKSAHWCIDYEDENKRAAWPKDDEPFWRHCPYGKPGDQLWVRETFARCACDICRKIWPDETPHGIVGYRATYPGPSGMVFKPSIFMPRWASRITLEVTKVRVERVQEISVTDIRAEGCFPYDVPTWRGRWDAINGKRGFGWEKNPWVWVIEFQQISSEAMHSGGRDPRPQRARLNLKKKRRLEQAAREFRRQFYAKGGVTIHERADLGLDVLHDEMMVAWAAERERQVWAEAAKVIDDLFELDSPILDLLELAKQLRARGEQVK